MADLFVCTGRKAVVNCLPIKLKGGDKGWRQVQFLKNLSVPLYRVNYVLLAVSS